MQSHFYDTVKIGKPDLQLPFNFGIWQYVLIFLQSDLFSSRIKLSVMNMEPQAKFNRLCCSE